MVKVLPVPGPNARKYIEMDSRYISPSYTRSYPFVMSHGKGSEVWDVDGNRFIDFNAGIAVVATGHSHPEVVKAIQEQAEKFIHMAGTDFYYPQEIELAKKLNEIRPMKEEVKVFLTNSGTESVESAIKLARYVTGRPRFIAFLGGFHGRTMGSLAFTASKAVQRARFFPMMPGVVHVPFPNPYRPLLRGDDQGEAVLDYIENVIFKTIAPPEEVAAFLVEPIQGEGGYVVPPESFFPGLRKLADEHGILIIVDEVQSGMGRTGKMYAIEHTGIEPDIYTMAKGIASGMPLGAMAARKSLMTWVPGAHGNTFGGNPVSCVASLKTIELLQNGYMENARVVGEYLMGRLKEMQQSHPSIGDVRGRGLMVGVELVLDRETKEPAHDLRDKVVDEAFKRGLLLLGCGTSTIRISPALNITREIVDEALEILDVALGEAEKAYL